MRQRLALGRSPERPAELTNIYSVPAGCEHLACLINFYGVHWVTLVVFNPRSTKRSFIAIGPASCIDLFCWSDDDVWTQFVNPDVIRLQQLIRDLDMLIAEYNGSSLSLTSAFQLQLISSIAHSGDGPTTLANFLQVANPGQLAEDFDVIEFRHDLTKMVLQLGQLDSSTGACPIGLHLSSAKSAPRCNSGTTQVLHQKDVKFPLHF